MGRAAKLWNTFKLASQGRSLSSVSALFAIGLLSQYPRLRLRVLASSHLLSLSKNGRVEIIVGRGKHTRRIQIRLGDLADYQSLYECFMGVYELPRGAVRYVFDGGANIGMFSVMSAMRLAPQEVVAVEPDPSNFDLMSENVAGLPVKMVQSAIWDDDGSAMFARPASNQGHVEVVGEAEAGAGHKVETRRLAGLVPAHWDMKQTWMKLDIEGAEYRAFRNLLANGLRPAYISAEIHDYLRSGGPELVAEIRDAGYEVAVDGYGSTGNVCRQIFATRMRPPDPLAAGENGPSLEDGRARRAG